MKVMNSDRPEQPNSPSKKPESNQSPASAAKPSSSQAARAKRRSGGSRPTPMDHFARRLRELRHNRGWSLEDLATVSEVSRSMLSEIERGRAIPTVAVAWRIARALGVSLNDLVDSQEAVSCIEVVRATDKAYLYRSDEHCTIRTLSPLHMEKDVEFYELRLAPKGELRSAPHYQGTREFLTVAKGRVRVEVESHIETLGQGDSATYPADRPHAIVNIGSSQCILFLVVIYE